MRLTQFARNLALGVANNTRQAPSRFGVRLVGCVTERKRGFPCTRPATVGKAHSTPTVPHEDFARGVAELLLHFAERNTLLTPRPCPDQTLPRSPTKPFQHPGYGLSALVENRQIFVVDKHPISRPPSGLRQICFQPQQLLKCGGDGRCRRPDSAAA